MARRLANPAATRLVRITTSMVAPSAATPPPYSTDGATRPPSRIIASRARPAGQATTAPVSAAASATTAVSVRTIRRACRGVAPMTRSRPISVSRRRTATDSVETSENIAIRAPQPPMTAPMMMSVVRSSPETGPVAVSTRVANAPTTSVLRRIATNVAVNEGRRCRNDRQASPVMTTPPPQPARRGGPAGRRRPRPSGRACARPPARPRGTRRGRRKTQPPGRGSPSGPCGRRCPRPP